MEHLIKKVKNGKKIYLAISKREIEITISDDYKVHQIKWIDIRKSGELKSGLHCLLNSCNLKIVHDFKGLLMILHKKRFKMSGPVFDIMIASQLLDYERPTGHCLQQIYQAYFSKGCSESIPEPVMIKELYNPLALELHQQGLQNIFSLEMKCVHPVTAMEINGIAFNKESAVNHDNATVKGYLKHVNPNTGRIHPEYSQIGSATGRITCSNSNIQGVPKKKSVRSLFIAPPEKSLIIADYNQIELRIIAEVSGDKKMIDAYKNSIDLHTLTASLLLEKPIEDVIADERNAAKAINFGILYGMGPTSLSEYAKGKYNINLTESQAKDFKSRFFENFSGIAEWYHSARQNGHNEVRTKSGRLRKLPEESPFTKAINTPIQGTASDILKEAICLIYQETQGTDSLIVAVIHDEIILETIADQATEMKEKLIKAMVAGGERYLKNVPVVVDSVVAETWADK